MSDHPPPVNPQSAIPDPQFPARPGAPLGRIFLAFLRLGLTAFGGPAMVAYIRDLAVGRKRWVSGDSFEDGVALCQSIPGATAMQTAAYAGLRTAGPAGAAAAFVGFALPAFVLMVILSAAYQRGHRLAPVVSVLGGLNVIVVALVANATLNFARKSVRQWRDALLAAGAALFLGLHGKLGLLGNPIVAIVAAGLVGLVLYRRADLASGRQPASQAGGASRMLQAAAVLLALAGVGLALLFVFNRPLFSLAVLMVKVDLFAFGGGFASVPVMLHEVVDVRGWMSERAFMDGIGLGQVTPGPIVITATFVGYCRAGLAGAAVATVSVFTPSFLMVLVTVPYFDRLQRSAAFRRALRGVLVSFVGLLLAVTATFAAAIPWSPLRVLLALAAFTALWLKADILWVVLAGAAVSLLIL